MNYAAIIEKTYELVETLKTSEQYVSYLAYEKKVLDDQEATELLKVFQDNKEKFEEAHKYKSYYPQYDEIKKQYQEAKINLMNNALFKTYKIYEKEIDSYINEIEFRLKEVVNIREKHGKININIR